MPGWRGNTLSEPAAQRGKFGNYLNQSAKHMSLTDVRVLFAREILTRFFAVAKLLKGLVARDGIEPPTPAFSGPLTESPKWFEINGRR